MTIFTFILDRRAGGKAERCSPSKTGARSASGQPAQTPAG